ncbi:helix-turn-helix transcriptional regulator [Streptomyces sp. NPDC059218]|uniref:helix-turn-helix transcriptional regulator n=1 Tax=unclassified Streptomyces TaxID=2593676 RepID=UPI0036D0784C
MADEDQEAGGAADTEPTALPLPGMGWRTQALLGVLLEDPSREVWPYWLDQRAPTRGGDNYQILKRLARAGWLTTRRETGKVNARVLYRLTPTGEVLAREAVKRSVKWPSSVAHHRPSTEP